ncbi:MAG TPA: outer membrane protein assembly factor BamD [Porphyromonadaceae bacterium]|jgi:outer membrane protein assembly factor BamD|uniref:outer membrane protein assembly factor BamD n=1 Tax=Limibacterium fermenti TaxID=3229863 RepID=UPI000E932536|nr:outer membrane protein assembly factor BamD [Porphyromonadaceae bacterium]HBK32930.1 outer membrane protein assembly factor BamD [Porphyromonadaceae bacterium]HBL33591.1 outer membrane protein assembly factor BamD [Porphyromonadaceae bacterium]HBX19361.1 outer membrane protein assembly factor BamD [Porphyromonadaceae bacterium]HBX45736.1 outer membrane protein assembly factor BamD [Porphyromonadaceae bacterium]
MRLKYSYFLLVILLFASCGEYNKILKSTDTNLKYTYAKKYFEEGKYERSITLLEELVPFMKGTANAEESLYLLGQSYYNSKDYSSATQIFTTYYTTYPKGEYAEPSLFYSAYGMYLDSPDARLDQTKTYTAIAEFQRYMEKYPQSERAEQAKNYMFELQEKLAYKELLAAQLYLNLGNYMGNNYESAIITAREAMKSYPFSKYVEDYQMIMLRSRYEYAQRSTAKAQPERFRLVVDEYFNYKNTFPEGKFVAEADKYYREAQKKIELLPTNN